MEDLPPKLRFVGLFLIGAGLGRAALPAVRHATVWAPALAVLGLTVWAAWQAATIPIAGDPAFALAYAPAALAGPVLILAASQWCKNHARAGPLALLGHHTMAIFVTHILITAGVRIGLMALGVEPGWAVIGIATALGIVLPLWAARLAHRMKLSRALGL